MLKRAFLLLLVAIAVLVAQAQEGTQVHDDAGRTLYASETYAGVKVHGDGWGLQFFHARHRTARMRHLYGVEFVGMKHPKEVKSFNPWYDDARGYFYGKQNSLIVFRPVYGRKYRITEKMRRSGVEVSHVWAVGPAVGLLKPVYLQIGTQSSSGRYTSISTERYDPELHVASNIYGRASWFNGLGELSVVPGLHARTALSFEYASENAGYKALEIGVAVDIYPQDVPIMAEMVGVTNKWLFLEFSLALQFGAKKTR